MHDIETLTASVRRRGGKVTAQRLLIWQALRDDRTHPTAEDLFTRLRPQASTLSLTTVYNVLNELVEWGEVRRFDIGDGRSHFDPDTGTHAELICMRCHSVIDILPAEAGGAFAAAPVPTEIAGYQIVARSEQYYGFCPACRREMEGASKASWIS
jgi:Fur family transcriptional regulator, peroxide stress response regulator